MTNCPVRVHCRIVDGKWKIGSVKSGYVTQPHNHAATNISGFPEVRRQRIAPYKDEIITDWNNGIAPAQILTKLQQRPELQCLQHWDVTNLLQRHTSQELNGRTPIEWLYDLMHTRTDNY
jgi:hypothetical protein